MQNKISSLEKQNGLWKTSGDKKIGIAIASLLNTMYGLVTLAKIFELFEELYYGGCFEKILSSLGHNRARKFISKCNDPNEKRPAEWERLNSSKTNYENDLPFWKKAKDVWVLIQNKILVGALKGITIQSPVKPVNAVFNEAKSGRICHICDNYGHVVATNCVGREDVPSVEMTTNDRRKILFEKKKSNLMRNMSVPRSMRVRTSFIGNLELVFMFSCTHHRESQENQRKMLWKRFRT